MRNLAACEFHREKEVYAMKILHSPACRKLLNSWRIQPYDSVLWRMGVFAADHTDVEIRDYLLEIIADDPADSEPVVAARELWPLLVFGDPLHEPEELLDELDAVIREHEMLRLRTEALAAKYRALQPWSERWDRYPHPDATFGDMNVDRVVSDLMLVHEISGDVVARRLTEAREHAVKIRVYDDTIEEIR